MTEEVIPAIAKMRGVNGYRWAVVDHPITSHNQEQPAARANIAAPQVAAALLDRR